MKNPFKRRSGTERLDLPYSSLARRLVYDSRLHSEAPEAVLVAMGMSGASPEVSEMESELSEKRRESLEPLIEYLIACVTLLTSAHVVHARVHDKELDDTDITEQAEFYAHIMSGAIYSTLANAIALGLLDVAGETMANE